MDEHRGTTPETEERRVRPREENDAVGTWLERLFDATSELVVFSIPGFLLVVLLNSATMSGRTIATATGFILAGAAIRRGTLPVGDGWPKTDSRWSVVRLGYFNVVVIFGLVVPGLVGGATGAGAGVLLPLAAVLGGVYAVAFALLVGRLER